MVRHNMFADSFGRISVYLVNQYWCDLDFRSDQKMIVLPNQFFAFWSPYYMDDNKDKLNFAWEFLKNAL